MSIPSVSIKNRDELSAAFPPTSTSTTELHVGPHRVAWAWMSLPIATILAFAVHGFLYRNETAEAAQTYFFTLAGIAAFSTILAIGQVFSPFLREWLEEKSPLVAAALVIMSGLQLVTTGLHWLPAPYFPSPPSILQSLRSDWRLLFDSTWHSLLLLLSGYTLGVVVALITGVCIGWFPRARYWGMPLLKVLGPIPATAWVPLAMILSPSGVFSAVGLVALAVWFPVSMLTISGIANVRTSYLDVARTLGADSKYLIFRVALPAAMPSIFIGLFMGLGTSFLTLIVAETVGVKSGLGWYVSWAQGWAEYGKVYAALLIMALFFSTIMTALFKIRDRVLVWQKGVIKW